MTGDWLRRFLRLIAIEALTRWKRNAGLRSQIRPPTLEEARVPHLSLRNEEPSADRMWAPLL